MHGPFSLATPVKAEGCYFKKCHKDILLLTNHETPYILNIVLRVHQPLSQSLPFLQLQVCGLLLKA